MNVPSGLGDWLSVVAVFALVATNGFFVASEFALVKLRVTRVEQLVLQGNAVARILQRQTAHLDSYIAATQLGITLASLALGWIGEPALAHLIEPLVGWVGTTTAATEVADGVAVALSFALITGFHIVLGELVPKSVALQRTEQVALFVAAPLLLFARVFHPFIALLNGAGNAALRLLGLSAAGEAGAVHSVEELELLVSQSRQAGVLEPEEEVLLRRVFDFGDKRARDAMRPRGEIVALEERTPLDVAARTCLSSGYTRLPVYRETFDQVVGVLHAKDLLQACFGDAVPDAEASGTLAALVRPATFVLEQHHLSDVLTTFRRERAHLALVVDEYGQVVGLLTLEDVLEELVGEIQDEYDVGEAVPIIQRADGSWLVAGTEAYDHVREVAGLPPLPAAERGQFNTLPGLLMLRLGRVPRVGDRVRLGDDWEAEVVAMEGRRVSRVLLRPRAGHNTPHATGETEGANGAGRTSC